MVQIDDKLISLDVFEKQFICDVPKCLGICCVEGESGAPLEDAETEILEKIYPLVKPLLSAQSITEIEKQGKWVIDMDEDKVTPIINGKECVYAVFEEDGVCSCAIEKIYAQGLIDFKKPISCHLYPIRVEKMSKYEALNYHNWPICNPARVLGKSKGVPVYQFLKEPIIRKYGQVFYDEMVSVHIELKGSGLI